MIEKMKDSGIEWIGEIPEEWNIKKIKYILKPNCTNLRVGPFGSALSEGDIKEEGYWVYNQRCVLDQNFEYNDTCIDEDKYKELIGFRVLPNDILITTRGSIGKVAVVPDNAKEGILHPCIIKFVIDNNLILNKLIELIFNESDLIYDQILRKSNATTIDVIYSYTLKELVLPVIPIEEQQIIINFLDKKTSQTDDILADLNRQVEILNKYKKSLITETVTKGLNLNAEMKDSGIEWIGEIPKEWEIKPLKYFTNFYNGDRGENYPLNSELTSDGIPFINAGDIANGEISFLNMSYITEEKYNSMGGLKIQDNDLIYCLRGSVGKNALVHFSKGTVNSCMVGIRCRTTMNPKYFYYCMNSYIEDNWRYILSSGSVQAQMGADILKMYKIPIPNIMEQQEIVDYLDKKCSQIDSLMDDKKKQIEKIESYKKSLIYEYVTGKKRVKGV